MNLLFTYNNKEKFLAFVLLMTVCWYPISRFILGFDHNGRFPLLLLLVSLFVIWKDIKSFVFSKPFCYLFLLNAFIVVNSIWKGLEGFGGDTFVFFTLMVNPLIVMLIVTYLFQNDIDKTLFLLVCVFGAYTFFCILDSNDSDYSVERLGEVINSNTIALNVLFVIVFAQILYIRNTIKLIHSLALMVFPLYTIVSTGSRMGLISAALIIVFSFVFTGKKSVGDYLKLLFIAIILFFTFTYIIDNTVIGERLLGTSEQAESYYEYETGTFVDYLGDRGPQYYLSWPVFLENFWTGIGFSNWRLLNPFGLVCHSEYMVLYLENGVIAFCLYLFTILWLYLNLWRKGISNNYSDCKNMYAFLLLLLSVMLLINFVIWTYDSLGYFSVFSLVTVVTKNYNSEFDN